MTDPYTRNPFEVLRLDPSAPSAEVVQHAGALRQRAAGEADVAAIRQAVQALTGRPEERRLHELLTHPRPCYRWGALDRFQAAFRRLAPAAAAPDTPCPALDLEEVASLLRALAVEQWEPPPLPFTRPEPPSPPDEIEREIVEALWQALLYDSRA